MVIGRIGTISEDGTTIVYDANSESIFEMKIPHFPEGTEIYQDEDGKWRAYISEGMPKETANRLKQTEDFYYLTRTFLPYKSYIYVQNRFPTSCAKQFKANPFFLTDIYKENSEVPVCSVPVVDKAITLATFEDRIREMKYVIRYCLEWNENEGHTWITYNELNKRIHQILKKDGHALQTGDVSAYLRYFSEEFYFEESKNIEESKVALLATYNREKAIYKAISFAVTYENKFPRYNPEEEEDLSMEQNNAVKNLPTMGGHISILTGGPGTGKTTILRTMVTKLISQYPDIRIHLLSPTGKAAKRIQEVFGSQDVEVSTVHKFLGYGHTLTRRELNVIHSADVVIIDESSMLDLDIFERLITMLNLERTKIILVGDVDQLPSIGAGNILSDLIHLGIHTEWLTENYRSQGSIVSNARKINQGILFLKEDESFQILKNPSFIADYLSGMDRNADIVITPYRTAERPGSSRVVNEIVQTRQFSTLSYNGYHVGDNVIMIHTNYKQGYFNGETGVILSYLPNGDYVIGFGDRELTVKDLHDMDLGYAITVHKSQGSEYPDAVLCIPEYSDFITRRMLYTAVTRAKRKLKIYVKSKEVLRKIIMNNPEELRRTFLSSFPKIAA